MSILQIGTSSRYLQASTGCRKYVNPFLSYEQRSEIQRQKQSNQQQYRQVLLDQMKQKQREKQFIKRKQAQEDKKHQRQFYEKLRKVREPEKKQNTKRNDYVSHSLPLRAQHDIPTHDKNNIFKKNYQMTLPPLMTPKLYESLNNGTRSIFSSKRPPAQSSYLKSQSLMDIGNRLIKEGMGRSVMLDQEIDRLNYEKIQKNWSMGTMGTDQEPEKKYKQLKGYLREKEIQIYELLEKSAKTLENTKSPLRQIKKRLKTQQIYIPEDQSQEEDESKFRRLKFRVKTQFGTRHLEDDQKFYRLPSLRSSQISGSSQNKNTFTLGQEESITLNNLRNDDIIKIEEENPQNEHLSVQNYGRVSPKFEQV